MPWSTLRILLQWLTCESTYYKPFNLLNYNSAKNWQLADKLFMGFQECNFILILIKENWGCELPGSKPEKNIDPTHRVKALAGKICDFKALVIPAI